MNHKPIFEIPPKNITAQVESNVTFEIKFISHLHPSWTWFKQQCLNDSACNNKVKIEVKVAPLMGRCSNYTV